MTRLRTGLVGRESELAELCDLVRDATVTVVRGESGSGRTTLLTELGARARAAGTTVIEVRADPGGMVDGRGMHALLAAVRERFEHLSAGPELIDAIHTVGKLCTYEQNDGRGCTSATRRALQRLFTALAAGGGVVILVDGLHRAGDPPRWFRQARQAGHAVVTAPTAQPSGVPDTAETDYVADRVLTLDALGDDETEALVRRYVGAPVDVGLLCELWNALGDLWGNPRAVVSTLRELSDRDRLVLVDELLCLGAPDLPIPLGSDHPLFTRVNGSEGQGLHLVLAASAETGLDIDHLPAFAEAVGRPVAECGRVLDDLVRDDVLVVDVPEIIRVRCPGVGTTLIEQAGQDNVRGLHSDIASAMLARGILGSGDEQTLLGHVERAGSSFVAPRGMPMANLLVPMLRALVADGQYERVSAVLDEFVARPDMCVESGFTDRDEVAATAALASMHTGRPVRSGVAAALEDAGATCDPLSLCADWHAGVAVSITDIEHAFAVLATTDAVASGRRRHPRVAAALAVRDPVPAFEAVLGAAYRVSAHGPLAAYHRLREAFARSDCASALSAARELSLTAAVEPVGRSYAYLLAAEIHRWQGSDRLAERWLSSVPPADAVEPVRGWVRSGLRYQAGDPVGALCVGWEAYRGSGPGGPELLTRLGVIALESGDRRFLGRLHAEAERRHLRDASARSRETWSLLRGLLDEDSARLRAAAWLARARGSDPELLWTCLALGMVSDDPVPWLHELLQRARDVGSKSLETKAKQLIEVRGAALPRDPAQPDGLSDMDRTIVDLIRSGRTNRQIAAATLISEKTVEKYLTRIFLVTGSRSRHELAAAHRSGNLERMGA